MSCLLQSITVKKIANIVISLNTQRNNKVITMSCLYKISNQVCHKKQNNLTARVKIFGQIAASPRSLFNQFCFKFLNTTVKKLCLRPVKERINEGDQRERKVFFAQENLSFSLENKQQKVGGRCSENFFIVCEGVKGKKSQHE